MNIITYHQCPCCGSVSINKKMAAEDFTVSHQSFEIWECSNCTLQFTQNVPDAVTIGAYYQSDAYVSHTETKSGIINQLYHLVRKRTLRKKYSLIKKYTGLHTGALTDIGAGTGAFANAMQSYGWNVTALEPDAGARQKAKEIYGLNEKDIAALYELSASSFDAVTMWHVLEHVHALHDCIAQIKKILRSNGKAFIAVPNYTSYDQQVYGAWWAAYDVPRHLYHFSPKAMEQLLQQHQLKITAIEPMWFDSFYISMLSEQYKNGKNNLLKAAWIGLLSNCKALFNKKRCSSVIYVIE